MISQPSAEVLKYQSDMQLETDRAVASLLEEDPSLNPTASIPDFVWQEYVEFGRRNPERDWENDPVQIKNREYAAQVKRRQEFQLIENKKLKHAEEERMRKFRMEQKKYEVKTEFRGTTVRDTDGVFRTGEEIWIRQMREEQDYFRAFYKLQKERRSMKTVEVKEDSKEEISYESYLDTFSAIQPLMSENKEDENNNQMTTEVSDEIVPVSIAPSEECSRKSTILEDLIMSDSEEEEEESPVRFEDVMLSDSDDDDEDPFNGHNNVDNQLPHRLIQRPNK